MRTLPQLLLVAEAAFTLGVAEMYLTWLIESGFLLAYDLDGLCVCESDIETLAKER